MTIETIGSNGHGNTPIPPADDGNETPEEIQVAIKNLGQLGGRQDGTLVSMSKQQLSLLQQALHSPDTGAETDSFIRLALILDFSSEEERRKVVDAYYEAVRLGMDTKWNIGDALSRCATNRPNSHHTNRLGWIGETLSHQKFTTNSSAGGKNGATNPRSPIG